MFKIEIEVNSNNPALYQLMRDMLKTLVEENKIIEPDSQITRSSCTFNPNVSV